MKKINLNYNPNAADAIVQMANDDYYGSDFAKIHQVIDVLFDQGFFTVKCADFVRPADLVNDFDNGNWETLLEQSPIIVPLAIHNAVASVLDKLLKAA